MRWWSRLLVALLWLFVALVTAGSLRYFSHAAPMRDFTALYQSAVDFRHTGFLYAPRHYINLNAPHVTVLLFGPLTLLSEAHAAVLWLALSLVCIVAGLGIIHRELALPPPRWLLWGGLLFGSAGVQMQWSQGQVGGVLLLVGALAWRAARHQARSTPVWLALLVSLKPVLLPLVFVEARIALRTIAVGLLGLLLGIWYCGLLNWTAWITTLQEVHPQIGPSAANLSLYATALRVAPTAAVPIWIASSATVLLVTGAVTWTQRPDRDRLWLLWSLTALLLSTISWTYYLFVLIGPLIAWGERTHWPLPAKLAIGCWLVPPKLLYAVLGLSGVLGSLYTWGVVVLWAVVAGHVFAQQRQNQRHPSGSVLVDVQ